MSRLSLRLRLVLAGAAAVVFAIATATAGLAVLFGAHVERQAGTALTMQLDQVIAGLTKQGKSWGLALRRGQSRIAQTTPASLGDDQLRAGTDQVGQDLTRLAAHDRAIGHRKHDVFTVGAIAPSTGPVTAMARRTPT